MSKSYAQLQKQIEVLQQQADQIRQKEIQGVVTRIKEAIQAYGLTASDLGLKAGVGAQAKSLFKRRHGGPKATKRGKAKGAPVAKFRDDAGNVWGGRGPRPRWLRDALAAGRTLQEFAA
jgi:DNA-binding protein H-NS